MAKKEKDEVTVSEVSPQSPSSGRIYTWNNGGRQQAIHESGIMLAMASPPMELEIPVSFFAADNVPVLLKDCDVEAVPYEALGSHKGLDKSLVTLRAIQEALVEPTGPEITTGEVSSIK